VKRIPATYLEVRSALSSGDYDAWHFSGHGGFSETDPNLSSMVLENKEPLRPEDLTGATRLPETKPFVFLNACQIGRGTISLTDIGGWAAQFIKAGAGAFVGAYWSIYDEPALKFAKSLYGGLLVGKPIGVAVKDARLEIKKLKDPTWLAYVVFADPLATVHD
jgi:CHAT domain-containing protein